MTTTRRYGVSESVTFDSIMPGDVVLLETNIVKKETGRVYFRLAAVYVISKAPRM